MSRRCHGCFEILQDNARDGAICLSHLYLPKGWDFLQTQSRSRRGDVLSKHTSDTIQSLDLDAEAEESLDGDLLSTW